MKKGLFALALGTFTLGIAEFIIEGIITDIANNMNVSIPEAGIQTQEYPDIPGFAHHFRSCHRLSST